MNPVNPLFHPLKAAALAVLIAGAPAIALAQSGDQMRDRTHAQDRLDVPDQDRDQDRMRDRDRVDVPDQDQDRLRTHLHDMDRLHDQIGKATSDAKRAQLRRQYRQQIEDSMQMLQNSSGPGPKASEQQRMEYMQQHMEQMQQMMHHMWEYQNQSSGS